MKTCTACLRLLSVEEFYPHPTSRDRRRAQCKVCVAAYYTANRDRQLRKDKERRAQHPEKYRARVLQKFGLSVVEYRDMLAAQDGVCAICRQPEKSRRGNKIKFLAVDHCHTTGKVRGLLCHNCNVGLGNFQDDLNLIEKAKEYLCGS